jgi:hypothetical protein
LGITREQVIILLSCAVTVSSIFVTVSLGNQVASYQSQVESLQSNLATLEASSELNRLQVAELEREAAEYKSRIVDLQNEVDRNEQIVSVWRTYRNRLEESYVENARLKGLLLEREIDVENFTAPTVMPRKMTFHIGEVITFNVESKQPLYGSCFTIWDLEGSLIWEGDPLGDWVEIEKYNESSYWVPTHYGQTAYLEPMVLGEGMLLGEWSWSYKFGDIVYIEGTFTVVGPYEDVLLDMD